MGDEQPVRRLREIEPSTEYLSRRVAAYAAMAGAAGVGLTLATPAKADIIYTPTDITFKTSSSLYIDLNHDGTNDFLFINQADRGLGSTTFLGPSGLETGNEILISGTFGFKSAPALSFGARIGPSALFSQSGSMADAYHGSITGAWSHAVNRYLGLEFLLDGQEHFGWAEFTVGQEHSGRRIFGIQATLEGYAYETIPEQAVLAGDATTASEPGTLGLLAMGSLGLGFWRRRQQGSKV